MQYELETKADLCPVCKGSGIYTEFHQEVATTSYTTQRTCHGCGGKGWVVIPTVNTTVTGG